jgi:hypothetical protein
VNERDSIVWRLKRRSAGFEDIWHAWRGAETMSVCGKQSAHSPRVDRASDASRPGPRACCFCLHKLGISGQERAPEGPVEELMRVQFLAGPFDGETCRLRVVRVNELKYRVVGCVYDRCNIVKSMRRKEAVAAAQERNRQAKASGELGEGGRS